jgi:hypothetical protein
MAERYDFLVFREGSDGKSYGTKVGTVWPRKNGEDGFSGVLDALPLDGRFMILPSKPREDRGGGGGGQGGGAPRGGQQGGQRRGYPDPNLANKEPNPDDDLPF